MLAGALLVIAGLLIAIHPPLLAWIVAGLLIAIGVLVIAGSWYNRRLSPRYENPLIEIFFRF